MRVQGIGHNLATEQQLKKKNLSVEGHCELKLKIK